MTKHIQERDVSARQRQALAKKGMAMPDGSFPIENEGDLKNAIQAIGRAKDPAAAKAHIKRRARAMGLEKMLPEDWMKESAAGSTTAALDKIRTDFCEKYPDKRGPMNDYVPGPWVRDIFLDEGYLVCSAGGDLYKVTFAEKDGEYDFAPSEQWTKVEITYVPAETPAAEESARQAAVESAGPRAGYFAEVCDLRESDLDGKAFIARNVTLIRPGFSTNVDKAGRPRYYPAATLKQAAAVFEGTRAYRNHPRRSDEKELPERDVRDIVGYYTKVKAADDGALSGDLHVVGEARAWLWPLIEETRAKPDLVALSINALGQTRLGEAEGRKVVLVERIVDSNSVDVVTTGGAGGSLAGALLQSDGDRWTADLLQAMAFEQWREARADYVARLRNEWKSVRETEALKEAHTALDGAKKKAAAFEEQNRAQAKDLAQLRRDALADRLLAESRLPERLRPAVREQMLEAGDEAGMRKVVEGESAKYRAAPRPPVPVTGAGQRTAAAEALTATPKANPAEQALGITESRRALPGETAEDFRRRMQPT